MAAQSRWAGGCCESGGGWHSPKRTPETRTVTWWVTPHPRSPSWAVTARDLPGRTLFPLFEPFSDERRARVDIDLAEPSTSGVHELVSDARSHHHDLSGASLQRDRADSECRLALEDDDDLVIGMPVQSRPLTGPLSTKINETLTPSASWPCDSAS